MIKNKSIHFKERWPRLLLILLWLGFGSQARAQGFLRADGQRIVNEKNENVLLRGVGLGGWMLQEGYMLGINRDGQQHKIRERIEALIGPEKTARFYEAWLNDHTTRADIDSMKRWGFNSVRLPMHYALYTLPVNREPVKGKQTWLDKGFAMTDSLLAWCKANEMYLILDLHAAPGGQGNDLNISDRDPSSPSLWQSEANRTKTIALWRKLAQRYAREPWIGGYDLINEPNWGFTNPETDKNGTGEKNNGPLQELLHDITKAIRQVDKKHLIILAGNGWGNNYNGIVPTWDKNMALSFHKYWNFNDEAAVAHMLSMRERYNMPAWLGETGENSNVWFTEAITLLEKHNIGWAWWPLKKLGVNNPLQVRSNADYDKLVAFWNGAGTQPGAAVAWRGLQQLLADLRIANNLIQADVLDAMLRQPQSAETRPFRPHVLEKNLLIQAADYDLGRNRYAYFDLDTANYRVSTGKNTAGNRGRIYRNDGVDLAAKGNQIYVTHIENSEWLAYTINVAEAGSYKLVLRTANPLGSGIVSVSVNGMQAGARLEKSTEGGTALTTIAGIELGAGLQRMVLRAHAGNFDLYTLELSK
ncbi:glycosyl hydrolase family 5 [Pedobacter yulinensis]|uniref:Glycosyl hydrolase family 5 n=1 Tax=Pedobacter yulinensis TaxID=2126353 RepID=A0A2T3HND7_9SPHI|nr:cellulase family glycosylhydrolase [Pedobacter yulinensis]PST83970.1 glycosyl hydrolase family 5 [Pedobacter yulinensis]